MAGRSIEDKAVTEILKDTKRAAARAAAGGPQSWRGGQGKEVNKRFLNNTVLSTVYNNSKEKKKRSAGRLTREDQALFKAAERFKAKEEEVVEVAKPEEAASVRKGKVAISSNSRLQAYLKAHKEKKEKEESKVESKVEKVEEKKSGAQPFWRVVEEED